MTDRQVNLFPSVMPPFFTPSCHPGILDSGPISPSISPSHLPLSIFVYLYFLLLIFVVNEMRQKKKH